MIWEARRPRRSLPARSRGAAAPPGPRRAPNSAFFIVFRFVYEAQETFLRRPKDASEKPKRITLGNFGVIFSNKLIDVSS